MSSPSEELRAARVRVTVALNGNQSIRTVGVISDWDSLLQLAANKLRLKKPSRVFDHHGRELFQETFRDRTDKVTSDALLVISSGADYVGTVRASENVDATRACTCQRPEPSWLAEPDTVDEAAILQLRHVAHTLAGVRLAVGMPDLHPGKGAPVGAVYGCHNWIHPFLIGGDIGCGMSLLGLPLDERKATPRRIEQWVSTLNLEGRWHGGDAAEWLTRDVSWPPGQPVLPVAVADVAAVDASLNLTQFHDSLGTVGGVNHFAELLKVERVVDPTLFDSLGLSASQLFLLVHSGSRGFGTAVLDRHAAAFGTAGLAATSPEAVAYLRLHDLACAWAKRNRLLIAQRFLATLDGTSLDETQCVLDIWHNHVVSKPYDTVGLVGGACAATPVSATAADAPASPCPCGITAQATVPLFLHRKGAAPSDQGLVVIPGSRGAFSYLVQPVTTGTAPSLHGWSLAHGAGRRLNRSTAQHVVAGKFRADELTATPLGSRVICGDAALLFEEAPEAYKDIDAVIRVLAEAQLLTVVCVFRPIITYKTK